MRRSRLLGTLSLLALVVAAYCFAGYVMNASFFGASDRSTYANAGVLWGAGGIASLVAALILATLGWRARGR